jgi:hypothetical protein
VGGGDGVERLDHRAPEIGLRPAALDSTVVESGDRRIAQGWHVVAGVDDGRTLGQRDKEPWGQFRDALLMDRHEDGVRALGDLEQVRRSRR